MYGHKAELVLSHVFPCFPGTSCTSFCVPHRPQGEDLYESQQLPHFAGTVVFKKLRCAGKQ